MKVLDHYQFRGRNPKVGTGMSISDLLDGKIYQFNADELGGLSAKSFINSFRHAVRKAGMVPRSKINDDGSVVVMADKK